MGQQCIKSASTGCFGNGKEFLELINDEEKARGGRLVVVEACVELDGEVARCPVLMQVVELGQPCVCSFRPSSMVRLLGVPF